MFPCVISFVFQWCIGPHLASPQRCLRPWNDLVLAWPMTVNILSVNTSTVLSLVSQ